MRNDNMREKRARSRFGEEHVTARGIIAFLVIFLSGCSTGNAPQTSTQQASSAQADWKPVEQAMGKAGSVLPDGVYKIGLPRSDLQVKVGEVELKPALALGSWVAFRKLSAETMVMGDLVLTEDEVGPVMSRLQEGGIEITALHNHVFNESPHILYMHIEGHGDAVKLAQAIHAAVALSKTPFTTAGPAGTPPAAPSASAPSEQFPLDMKQLDQIIGRAGKLNNGVDQFSIPRAEKITEGEMAHGGEPIPASMGLATAVNFQPTGAGRAAITGDFVLTAGEVNPVMQALRENGIAVTALHSHMLTESPRLFFMHFWANDEALKLARGIRAALDKTNSAK